MGPDSPMSSRHRGSRDLPITRQGKQIPARCGPDLSPLKPVPWRRNAGSKRSTNKYYCASDEGATRRRRAATSVLGKRVPLDTLSGAVKLFFRPACSYCAQSPWIKFSVAHFRCNSISASKRTTAVPLRHGLGTSLTRHNTTVTASHTKLHPNNHRSRLPILTHSTYSRSLNPPQS
jgi:hypothetical protein